VRALYFGCPRGVWHYREAGHRFVAPSGNPLKTWVSQAQQPWGLKVDGGLAPREWDSRRAPEMPQGVAALHHKDGWTALSFWDRSGDSRPASNSTFIFDAALDFDQAVAAARAHFAGLFERFPFEVVPHQPDSAMTRNQRP
jgi:hypothetical protein